MVHKTQFPHEGAWRWWVEPALQHSFPFFLLPLSYSVLNLGNWWKKSTVSYLIVNLWWTFKLWLRGAHIKPYKRQVLWCRKCILWLSFSWLPIFDNILDILHWVSPRIKGTFWVRYVQIISSLLRLAVSCPKEKSLYTPLLLQWCEHTNAPSLCPQIFSNYFFLPKMHSIRMMYQQIFNQGMKISFLVVTTSICKELNIEALSSPGKEKVITFPPKLTSHG